MEIGEAREAEQRKAVVIDIDWNALETDLDRVSGQMDLMGFLKKHKFSKHEAAIKGDLGVTEIEDLKYIERSDLADIGMSNVEQQRFMAAAQKVG